MPRVLSSCLSGVPAHAPQWRFVTSRSPSWKPADGAISESSSGSGYSWPGNIRELQNVIERSLIVCETDEFTIDKSWLSSEPMPTRSMDQASIEASVPGERDLIEAALAQTTGKRHGLY